MRKEMVLDHQIKCNASIITLKFDVSYSDVSSVICYSVQVFRLKYIYGRRDAENVENVFNKYRCQLSVEKIIT